MPGRLVEHDHVGIFEDDAQGERFRSGSGRAQLGDVHDEAVPLTDLGARADRLAGGGRHPALLDQPLDLRPRLAGQDRGQELIEPEPVLLFIDDQRIGLVHGQGTPTSGGAARGRGVRGRFEAAAPAGSA